MASFRLPGGIHSHFAGNPSGKKSCKQCKELKDACSGMSLAFDAQFIIRVYKGQNSMGRVLNRSPILILLVTGLQVVGAGIR